MYKFIGVLFYDFEELAEICKVWGLLMVIILVGTILLFVGAYATNHLKAAFLIGIGAISL